MSASRPSSPRHPFSAPIRPGFSPAGFSPTRFLSHHLSAQDFSLDTPFSASSPKPSRLSRELRERLLCLSYRAFLQSVLHLLSASGYAQVIPAGRQGFKGRNTGGGWDLEAQGFTGAGEAVRAIAQVKQFDRLSVQQRTVDELRGCLLRAKADEAWLITLSVFSAPAKEAAQATGETAPIRLLDGEALTEMMIRHQVGVCREGVEWVVNDRYFQSLERRFGKDATANQTKTSSKTLKSNREEDRRPQMKLEPSAGGMSKGGTVPPKGKPFSLRGRSEEPVPIVRVTIFCGPFPRSSKS